MWRMKSRYHSPTSGCNMKDVMGQWPCHLQGHQVEMEMETETIPAEENGCETMSLIHLLLKKKKNTQGAQTLRDNVWLVGDGFKDVAKAQNETQKQGQVARP